MFKIQASCIGIWVCFRFSPVSSKYLTSGIPSNFFIVAIYRQNSEQICPSLLSSQGVAFLHPMAPRPITLIWKARMANSYLQKLKHVPVFLPSTLPLSTGACTRQGFNISHHRAQYFTTASILIISPLQNYHKKQETIRSARKTSAAI